jgi:hypothetical protein
MSGFFGLEWTNNATIELIIEQQGFNNNYRSAGGRNATIQWASIYLQNATARFQALIPGFDWTIADTYAAQTLCPYETVSPSLPRI